MSHYYATAPSLKPTGARIDIYVDAATGNDNNPATIASPLATFAAAVQRLKYWALISPGAPGAVIHLAAGTYQVTTSLGPFLLDGPVFIIGDGAGQAGQDGFTELVGPSAAGVGSSTTSVVAAVAPTLNQYRGKTIQIQSGPAAGDLRTIRDNTTAAFTPSATFTAAVASGNTYRIVEPSVILEIENATTSAPVSSEFPALARSAPAACGAPLQVNTTGAFVAEPAIYYCNVRIKGRTGDADSVAVASILSSSVAFFGVELVADNTKTLFVTVDKTSLLLAGIDFLSSGITGCFAIRPFEAGFATGRRSWVGWGVAGMATGTLNWQNISRFVGFMISSHEVQLEDAEWKLCGGSIINTGGQALDLVRWAKVVVNSSASPTMLFRSETNSAGSLCIAVRSGGQLELQSSVVEKANQGYAICAQGENSGQGGIPGQIGIAASTVTITGSSPTTTVTGALLVTNGGSIYIRAGLTISGFTAGTELAVRDGGPAGAVFQQCDYADLAASGNVLPALPDRIFFLANGLLSGFVDAAAAGTFDAAAQIDGCRSIARFNLLSTIVMTQVVDGTAGTTSMEVFRRRAGANTSLGVVSLAQGGGSFAQATLTPASLALRTLLTGDILVAQFTARQTGTAANVSLEFSGAGVDGRFGMIVRE